MVYQNITFAEAVKLYPLIPNEYRFPRKTSDELGREYHLYAMQQRQNTKDNNGTATEMDKKIPTYAEMAKLSTSKQLKAQNEAIEKEMNKSTPSKPSERTTNKSTKTGETRTRKHIAKLN